MKKQLSIVIIVICLTTILPAGYAQDKTSKKAGTPGWVPDKGFWVIEGNKKTPLRSTICFYNDEKVLVYKEKIEGIQINQKRKKVLLRLCRVLEQSLSNWEVKHIAKENQTLVADLFKR